MTACDICGFRDAIYQCLLCGRYICWSCQDDCLGEVNDGYASEEGEG
jgi:hypothetical protein